MPHFLAGGVCPHASDGGCNCWLISCIISCDCSVCIVFYWLSEP